LFIFDEAHKCKNSKTINSKILISLAKYQVKILLLSATIIDKPLFFLPFGIVLKLYNNIQEGIEWMNKLNTSHLNKKSSNPMLPIHNILFNKYASRMRIDDTVGVFKNNKISFEGIEMKNYWEIEKKYDKINNILEFYKENKEKKQINSKEYIDTDLNNEELDNIKTKKTKKISKLGSIQILRQEIEYLRIDTICEKTFNFLSKNKSIVIFVNFTKTIKELCLRLNCNCVIWGSQTLDERTKAIDDFCLDKSRIIICNIQSGSAGISLHDTIGNYPRVSIISPTWSAQDLIQVLGRIHRAMGKTDCEQIIVFCKGTIEESVGNVIKQKINNIRLFNDGDKKIKNDNMEIILNNELNKKKKKQESNEYIYKTNDFDSIQNRIDKFEKDLNILKNELKNYIFNSHEYKECEYRIQNIQKELDLNLKRINETIENLLLN
jgi:superfamily II DNA or RNA helicase